MRIKKRLFILSACGLFAASLLVAQTHDAAVEQAATVDQQLHDLRTRRDRCKLRQKLAYDSAGRRQNLGDYVGYRRDMQTITYCKEKIKELDEKIAKLEKQKE